VLLEWELEGEEVVVVVVVVVVMVSRVRVERGLRGVKGEGVE